MTIALLTILLLLETLGLTLGLSRLLGILRRSAVLPALAVTVVLALTLPPAWIPAQGLLVATLGTNHPRNPGLKHPDSKAAAQLSITIQNHPRPLSRSPRQCGSAH